MWGYHTTMGGRPQGQFGVKGRRPAAEVTMLQSALYLATPEDMTAGPNEHCSLVTDGWQSAEAKIGRAEQVYHECS
jgi:hypothetical protein